MEVVSPLNIVLVVLNSTSTVANDPPYCRPSVAVLASDWLPKWRTAPPGLHSVPRGGRPKPPSTLSPRHASDTRTDGSRWLQRPVPPPPPQFYLTALLSPNVLDAAVVAAVVAVAEEAVEEEEEEEEARWDQLEGVAEVARQGKLSDGQRLPELPLEPP